MVFWRVRARVRDAISPILCYSPLFAAILGPECLVDFLFKVFLIFGSVPVVHKYLRRCSTAIARSQCGVENMGHHMGAISKGVQFIGAGKKA